MPYKRIGKKVMVKRGSRWVKKGSSTSIKKAKVYLSILNRVEKGIPIKSIKRSRRKK